MARSLVVAVCLLLSLQMAWSYTQVLRDCMAEHKVTKDAIMSVVNGKNTPKSMKCFMKCALMGHGMLSEDGVFDWSLLKKTKDTLELYKFATECQKQSSVKSSDLCELAYKESKCIMDKTPNDLQKQMVNLYRELGVNL